MAALESSLALLKNPEAALLDKYNAIFELKSLGGERAALALCEAAPLLAGSELLQHEALYALGQMGVDATVPFLASVLNDAAQSGVVRHEAGEALGNFPHLKQAVLPELLRHWDSEVDVVRATVRLAVEKVNSYEATRDRYNNFLKGTLEPAAPFTAAEFRDFLQRVGGSESRVAEALLDPTVGEFEKYRAVYHLRDNFSARTLEAYALLLHRDNRPRTSALLRHEVNFILGQLAGRAATPAMRAALAAAIRDEGESPVVRHEAVLAYSAVFGNDEVVREQLGAAEPLVRESAAILFD